MVLVLKLISTAFDVGDGAKRGATLTPHQATAALPRPPSFLAFAVRLPRRAAGLGARRQRRGPALQSQRCARRRL